MAQRKWKHCNQSLVPCLIAGNLVWQLIFVKVSITYLQGYLLCFGRTLVISISASSKFWRKTPVFIVVKSRFQWMSFNHISLNASEIKRERNKTWILLYDTSLLTCSNQNTLKITEYGFLICLCFFTKFFSIILFFFYFFLHKSKLKCFKGTCLCKFGKGLLNSLKFIHGKITTNKAKNKTKLARFVGLLDFFWI